MSPKNLSAKTESPDFKSMYRQSIDSPEKFWAEQGKCIDWIKPYTKIKDSSFNKADLHIRWFYDGTLNACYNCLDRHLKDHGETTALIWEGDDPKNKRTLTYKELHTLTCRIANVLKDQGIQKGDRVTIYLPMIPEAIACMLACARIGAVHSVVFAGFSSESLANRIHDCESKLLITADASTRGGKEVPLKEKTDKALAMENGSSISKVLVVRHLGSSVPMQQGRDYYLNDLLEKASADCPCEEMEAEDPLFILYTSGSTGKPKGVVHTTGGYMVYNALTHKIIFDYQPDEIFWCSADIGWITGHSYVVYGPLANRATIVIFEGIPTYPDYSRYWEMIDRYKVNTFYTAPTAIRALMREGDQPVVKTSRKSLRILGTVGEPINETAWNWYNDVVGNSQCPVVDTWWQTETGGIMLSPIPHTSKLKPGSVNGPFLGIKPAIVNRKGEIQKGEASGTLVITDSWPGQMRTVFGDHGRFYETYFEKFPGMYNTDDGARRDKDGDYWITGRTDDVINVSGHRLGTAEIESVLDEHEKVVETAVVGFPHEIKGQGIYAFVTLKASEKPTEAIQNELIEHIRDKIGPIAKPDVIQWARELPKTRSGKIMRRILRKIAEGNIDEIGDTSTLANPDIVDELIKNRPSRN